MAVNLINNEQIHVIQDGSNITLDIQDEALKNKNVVVDSIRSKNVANATTLKKGLWASGDNIGSNATGWYVVVSIEGGKTYTISKKYIGSLYATTTTTFPASGVAQVDRWRGNEGIKQLTITTSNSAKYLFLGLLGGTSPTDTQKSQAIEELMVEEGDTASTYSPYQNLNGEENYTTEETRIGTWLGKPLYRKVITRTVNANTNDNVSLSTLGITNQDTIIVNTGLSTAHYQISTTGGGYAPIVYYVSNTDRAHVYVNTNKELQIQNQNNNQRKYNIVLEYTKTTD